MREVHEIFDNVENKIVSRSRNLRGILDFARNRTINSIEVQRDCYEGILAIHLAEGSQNYRYSYRTRFASYTVLCDWLAARRSWHGAPLQLMQKDLTVCIALEKGFNSQKAQAMLEIPAYECA